MNTARIADQIAQVDRDLSEIDEQLEAGEFDEATAERLRAACRSERAALQEQLVGSAKEESDAGEAAAREGRSKSRAIIGTAVVGIAAVVVAVVAVMSIQERTPAGEVTDGIATEVLEGQVAGGQGGTDLSSVTASEMETVVAQNPEIVGMRIALAERYVEEGNISKAVEHYMIVLEQEPENAAALARVGWLTFVSGEAELAEPFVVRALVIEPDYPQAYWFLANIRFELGDMAGVVEPLELLLAYESVPTDVRAEATTMLEEARS